MFTENRHSMMNNKRITLYYKTTTKKIIKENERCESAYNKVVANNLKENIDYSKLLNKSQTNAYN